MRKTVEERFWEKVIYNEETGCDEWTGKPNNCGYGRFGYNGVMYLAHRFCYMLYCGLDSIPDDKEVCHTCDNRMCVTFGHLWLGTHQENIIDCIDKGRFRILTWDMVRDIRIAYSDINMTQEKLGTMFNVTRSNIQLIVTNKIWKE